MAVGGRLGESRQHVKWTPGNKPVVLVAAGWTKWCRLFCGIIRTEQLLF